MRKFEASQKEEIRAHSADSSKVFRKPRAFICSQRLVISEEYKRNYIGGKV